MDKVQLDNSDVVSFHNYDPAPEFEKRIQWLERYKRPLLCTEYMARGNGSTFESSLPLAKKYKVGGLQLGPSGRQDPDVPAVGLVEASVHRPRAVDLVPRGFPH